MDDTPRIGVTRWAWPALAAVLVLLGSLLYLTLLEDFAADVRLANQRAQQQMLLITDIVTGQLQGDHYQDIEPIFGRIGAADATIVGIQLTSVNGFAIASYQRPHEQVRSLTLENPVFYSYHRAAVLRLEIDLHEIYDHDRRLALQLAGIYTLISALLVLLTYIALRRIREAAQLRVADARLRDSNRTLRVLSDCNQALVRAASEQELMDDLCRILVQEGGYSLAWIGLAENDAEKRIRPAAAWGKTAYVDVLRLSWREGQAAGGPTSIAILSGTVRINRDTGTDEAMRPWRTAAESFGFRSSIALPLGGTIPALGALNLYADIAARFDGEEVRLLQELASDLSYGLQSLRNEQRRSAAEAQIEAQGKRFQALVESSGDGVALVRADGTLAYVGPSITVIMGYLPADMIGRGAIDFISPDDSVRFRGALQDCMAAPGRRVEARARVRHQDGRWLSMEGTFSNLLDDPDVGGIVINFRDITRRLALEQAQHESNERFEQIAANVSEAFWVSETSGFELLYVSPAYEKIWQRRTADLATEPLQWIEAVHPDDRIRVRKAVTEKQVLGLYDEEYRIIRPDGSVRWIRDRAFPVHDEQGVVYRIVGTAEDITESKNAALQIQYLNRIYALLSGINSLIVRARDRSELFREACRLAIESGQFRMAWIGVVDRDSRRVQPLAWSGDAREVLEIAPLGTEPSAGADFGLVGEAIATRTMVISNDVRNDPRLILREELQDRGLQSLAVMPLIVGGQPVGVFVLYSAEAAFFNTAEERLLRELAGDISFALEHIEKSEKIDYLAYYDPLTGLPNRALLNERITQRLDADTDFRGRAGLVLLDVDRFRAVNDSLGRLAGDDLVKQIAGRLVQFAGEPARLARTGSNQFAVWLADIDDAEEVAEYVTRLFKACFEPPFRLNDAVELRIAVKAGIAIAPDDGIDAEILQRNAEAALKNAKTAGEKYLFYAPHMNEKVAEKLSLESRLQAALERDEFILHYQPRIDLQTGAVTGVEALLRWQSPELGLLQPMQFIPILEETGLILEVGTWVIRQAARDYRRWMESGIAAPRIAVNVSAVQLRRADFVHTLRDALAPDPTVSGVDIELTESLLMEDIEGNVRKLDAAREMGVRIAIDDFGTGYSSLRYLAMLPVHTLKIDRSFVIKMVSDPNVMTLVSTVISMAHALGLEVVAEGVDQMEQAQALRNLACDQMQGYLVSRPIPDVALLTLLSERREGRGVLVAPGTLASRRFAAPRAADPL